MNEETEHDNNNNNNNNNRNEQIKEYTEEEFATFNTEQLSELLGNDSIPVAPRMRILWYLRSLSDRERAITILENGLKSESVLLKHEIAYVMGQLRDKRALPILNRILCDTCEDTMVRHEAGEALGAIGSEESIPILKQYLNDPVREVRETCELAIENIEHFVQSRSQWKEKEQDSNEESSFFQSIDPAPPISKYQEMTVNELRDIYLNMNLSLFQRYKAMFALRNMACTGTYEQQKEALKVLCEGFRDEEGPLFKHEIAFVLGQLQRQETAETLERVLRNRKQHAMVRHEAAEALGSICDPQSLQILHEFQEDKEAPVRDSCQVAVDMHNYWSKFLATSNSDE
jgi:deoxyhypusine monooxygenase